MKEVNILVVEDNTSWSDVISHLLKEDGYRVTVASSFEQAKRLLDLETFHVAIVDLRLEEYEDGDISGMQVLRDIVRNKLVVPNVIVLTGYGTYGVMREAFRDYKAWDFLDKSRLDPFDFREIVHRAADDASRKLAENLKVGALSNEWQSVATQVNTMTKERFEEASEAIVSFLAESWELPQPATERQIEGYKWLVLYPLDTSLMFSSLSSLSTIPLVFIRQVKLTDEVIQELQHCVVKVLKLLGNVSLVALFCSADDLPVAQDLLENKISRLYAHDAIPVDLELLKHMSLTPCPQLALRQFILARVDLVSVSPFAVTGPTPDSVFSGREPELREITNHVSSVSYAVIGGRRIGKSSLLGRLHRIRLPAAGFYTLYHDCSTTPTCDALLTATIHNWRPRPPFAAPATFNSLLQCLPNDKPLVLLLDEIDKLVPTDRANGWPLFNALRALANARQAQIVLSGERTLRDALRDPRSPLFNFANEMLLGPLDFRAVEELVTRPMKQLEIELVDEQALVDRIWAFTSGHPNIVQRLCHRLVKRLNEQGMRRITLDDVDAVIENPGFQRDDFLSTYWEAATSLERIISLLMANDENVRTLRTVRQALVKHCNLRPKARDVDDALQRLVDLRSILKRTPAGYEFAVEAFPRVVTGTMTLDDMLEILTEEYQEQGE